MLHPESKIHLAYCDKHNNIKLDWPILDIYRYEFDSSTNVHPINVLGEPKPSGFFQPLKSGPILLKGHLLDLYDETHWSDVNWKIEEGTYGMLWQVPVDILQSAKIFALIKDPYTAGITFEKEISTGTQVFTVSILVDFIYPIGRTIETSQSTTRIDIVLQNLLEDWK